MVTSLVSSPVKSINFWSANLWLQLWYLLQYRFYMCILLLRCEHSLEKYLLERRFFHKATHVLQDCKIEGDVKTFVKWIEDVPVETKSIFSQVRVICLQISLLQVKLRTVM